MSTGLSQTNGLNKTKRVCFVASIVAIFASACAIPVTTRKSWPFGVVFVCVEVWRVWFSVLLYLCDLLHIRHTANQCLKIAWETVLPMQSFAWLCTLPLYRSNWPFSIDRTNLFSVFSIFPSVSISNQQILQVFVHSVLFRQLCFSPDWFCNHGEPRPATNTSFLTDCCSTFFNLVLNCLLTCRRTDWWCRATRNCLVAVGCPGRTIEPLKIYWLVDGCRWQCYV